MTVILRLYTPSSPTHSRHWDTVGCGSGIAGSRDRGRLFCGTTGRQEAAIGTCGLERAPSAGSSSDGTAGATIRHHPPSPRGGTTGDYIRPTAGDLISAPSPPSAQGAQPTMRPAQWVVGGGGGGGFDRRQQ